ncbi:hypothetical protein HBE96_23410 [Clostridium sp. P21]|uniref:Uncharacterized protein n=1 Tax=Clostridium muellerianum TaxID=2716538 RepID=A0A7Y0EL85_9CLOT|nr:hypothetical protein [Clostridium muellerianum]NMM65529.1 hypothetical protein [Clostridium muellerianum]
MYCVEIGELKWCYETALEAWNNKHLQVRLSCSTIHLNNGAITGVKIYNEFVQHLDDDAVLQYHTLHVYKVVVQHLYHVRIALILNINYRLVPTGT